MKNDGFFSLTYFLIRMNEIFLRAQVVYLILTYLHTIYERHIQFFIVFKVIRIKKLIEIFCLTFFFRFTLADLLSSDHDAIRTVSTEGKEESYAATSRYFLLTNPQNLVRVLLRKRDVAK